MKSSQKKQPKSKTTMTRTKFVSRAVLNSILTIVLVVGLMPGFSYADDGSHTSSGSSGASDSGNSSAAATQPVDSSDAEDPASGDSGEVDSGEPAEGALEEGETGESAADSNPEALGDKNTPGAEQATANGESQSINRAASQVISRANELFSRWKNVSFGLQSVDENKVSFEVTKSGGGSISPEVDTPNKVAYFTEELSIKAKVNADPEDATANLTLNVGSQTSGTSIAADGSGEATVAVFNETTPQLVKATVTKDSDTQVFYYKYGAPNSVTTTESDATKVVYDSDTPSAPTAAWSAQNDVNNGILGSVSGAAVTYKTQQGKSGSVKTTATITVTGEKNLKFPDSPTITSLTEDSTTFGDDATTTVIGYLSGDGYLEPKASAQTQWQRDPSDNSKWTCKVVFEGPAAANSPKSAKIYVRAVDWCQKKAALFASDEMRIATQEDAAAPTLSMDFGAAVRNGDVYYYGKQQFDTAAPATPQIQATVTEADNYDKNKVAAAIMNGETPAVTGTFGDASPATASMDVPSANGSYTVKVTGTDGAGNPLAPEADSGLSIEGGVYTQDIVVDQNAPTITVSYLDKDDATATLANDGTAFVKYSDKAKATIEIADDNFDASQTVVTLNDTVLENVQWSSGKAEITLNADDGEVTANELKVTSTDLAGNSADAFEGTLKVDRKAPELSLTWEENETYATMDGKNYYTSRKATIEVIEDNFVVKNIAISVTPEKPDGAQAISTGEHVTWTHDGTKHTAVINFQQDCENAKITISGTDAFNNVATEVSSEEFVILSKPVVGMQFAPDTADPNRALYSFNENGELTATITVLDPDFSSHKDGISVSTGVGGLQPESTTLEWAGEDSDLKHTATLVYKKSSVAAGSENGQIALTVPSDYQGTKQSQATWNIGKEPVEFTSASWTKSFAVDVTQPMIVSVSYDKTEVEVAGDSTSTLYFTEAVNATVKIDELNVDSTTGEPLLVQYKKSTDESFTSVGVASSSGIERTFSSVPFTGESGKDVSYDFKISGTDFANNKLILKDEAHDLEVFYNDEAFEFNATIVIAQGAPQLSIEYTPQGTSNQVADGALHSNTSVIAAIKITDLALDSSTTVTVDSGENPLTCTDAANGVYECQIELAGEEGEETLHALEVNIADKIGRKLAPGRLGTTVNSASQTVGSVDSDGKYSADVLIDQAGPVLKVTYEPDPAAQNPIVARNGDSPETRYYGKSDFANAPDNKVKVVVSVTDGSFNAANIDVKWDGASVPLTREAGTNKYVSATQEVSGQPDKDYLLTVSGTDAFGNALEAAADSVTPGGFDTTNKDYKSKLVVDGTRPLVTVSYATEENGSYTNLGYDTTASVDKKAFVKASFAEANFDPTRISIKYSTDGTAESAQNAAINWDGNVALFELPASETPGSVVKYTLYIDGTDLAGNKLAGDSADTETAQHYKAALIIDQCAPTLEITYTTTEEGPTTYNQNRYYNASFDTVTATIKITEKGSGLDATNGINITCSGTATVSTFSVTPSGNPDEYIGTATVTLTKQANAEAQYDISVSGNDLVGNKLELAKSEEQETDDTIQVAGDTFTSTVIYDAKAPTLFVTWSDSGAQKNGKYFSSNRTASISVTEQYFLSDDIAVYKNKNTDPVDSAAVAWVDASASGGSHTMQAVEFTDAADEQFLTVGGTDIAGNKLTITETGPDDMGGALGATFDATTGTYHSGMFVVDTVAPQVVLKVLNNTLTRKVNNTDFFKGTSTLEVQIQVTDDHFDTREGVNTITPSGTGTVGAGWINNTRMVTYLPNPTYDTRNGLNVTLCDLAGNTFNYQYGASSSDGHSKTVDQADKPLDGADFVLDTTAPSIIAWNRSTKNVPTQMFSGSLNSSKILFYKNATALQLAVDDALGVFKAGSEGSAYTTSLADATSVLTSRRLPDINLQDAQEFTNSFVLTAWDCAGNSSSWRINPGIGTVTPLYDSINVHPDILLQDTVSPQVSWSGVTPGQYYNSDQSATLSIFERNFRYIKDYNGGLQVAVENKQEGNAGRAASSATFDAASMNAVDAMAGNYSRNIAFTNDGHYTLSAQFSDSAGNASNLAEVQEFTIDKTAPTIEVSWDNNNARNGNYYNAARTATITITEHNFEASGFRIETTGSIGGWSSNGDTHVATVSFATDGRYTMTVSGADKAGNALATYTEQEFVIDLTRPQITFSLAEDHSAYNRDSFRGVAITYTDEANLDTAALQKTLTGAKHGTRAEFASSGAGASGNSATDTYSPESFIDEVESDDIYTLTAHMADMAGNEADGQMMFSLNRYGSNFIVEDAEAYEDGYLAEAREVRVREINVVGAESENHGVTITHGLNTENLSRGTSSSGEGFFIDAGQDGSGWASYLYHIGAGNFSKEGNYHVAISSTDKTDNINNSTNYYDPQKHSTADAEVSFILDKQDPIIDALSVANGGVYDANNHPVTFSIIDNIGYKNVSITLDGQKLSEGDYSIDTSGLCTVNVQPESFRGRNMDISVTDNADRSAQETVTDFHITTNVIELNLPFVIGGVIVIIVAAVGVVLFIRRRSA